LAKVSLEVEGLDLRRAILPIAPRRSFGNYPSQHVRFILFFPEEETDKTISTLLPQMLQRWILPFASARAPTSVFDFPFSAISIPPFC